MKGQHPSLVQRLLRGRALYITLALFIVMLYLQGLALRHAPHTPAEPAEVSETKTVPDLAQPWPARTDMAMLQDAAEVFRLPASMFHSVSCALGEAHCASDGSSVRGRSSPRESQASGSFARKS